MIIQLYVPGSLNDAGLTSSYAQQYKQLQKQIGTKTPNVMQHYTAYLHALLQQVSAINILLMRDVNAALGDNQILDLYTNHNFRDAYAHCNPGKEFNTQALGFQGVNYFLISAPLLPLSNQLDMNLSTDPSH